MRSTLELDIVTIRFELDIDLIFSDIESDERISVFIIDLEDDIQEKLDKLWSMYSIEDVYHKQSPCCWVRNSRY